MCILCHYPGCKSTVLIWVSQRIWLFFCTYSWPLHEFPVCLMSREILNIFFCLLLWKKGIICFGHFCMPEVLWVPGSASSIVYCSLIWLHYTIIGGMLPIHFYWYSFDDWWQRPYAADIDMYMPWNRVVAFPSAFCGCNRVVCFTSHTFQWWPSCI